MLDKKRTIEEVLSFNTGILQVDYIFREPQKREAEIFQLRTLIETQIQTNQVEYVCRYCKQPVAIRGLRNIKEKTTQWYFTHPYRSDDCIIKTQSNLTDEQLRCIEYNDQKESLAHYELKYLLGEFLQKEPGIITVKIDKVYKEAAISRKWRKPDVLSIYEDKKIAFEIQLRTTYLSVIVGRTIFYKERGIYLIWVFRDFSIESDSQRFTEKDVYYNNNVNVYVFDKDAQNKSNETNRLNLKCFFKKYYTKWGEVLERWDYAYVTLSDLTFENKEVYYYNSIKEKERLSIQIEEENIAVNIKDAIDYLVECYKLDYKPYREDGYNPLDSICTPEEIRALNRKINYTKEKADKILQLFIERKKPYYLKTICLTDIIEVDTSIKDQNGKTIFQNLLEIDDIGIFKTYMSYLFRKGYIPTDQDIQDHRKLFTEKKIDLNEKERIQIDKWGYIWFLLRIDQKKSAIDILKTERILYAILSLKLDRVIGYGFNNLRQITNNVYNQHPEYGMIYYEAMSTYYQVSRQFEEDKHGKLRSKVLGFIKAPLEQTVLYNQLIHSIFTELS